MKRCNLERPSSLLFLLCEKVLTIGLVLFYNAVLIALALDKAAAWEMCYQYLFSITRQPAHLFIYINSPWGAKCFDPFSSPSRPSLFSIPRARALPNFNFFTFNHIT